MRTLPQIYSQRDPHWAGQRLGTVDGTTIGSDGCFITSFAMLACYYQHPVSPAALDDLFTSNGWYTNGNLLNDNDLVRAFPDIQYVESDHYETVPADLAKLQLLLTDPSVSVILELDFNPEQAGTQTHFVVAVDCDGANVTIADPWTGTIRSVSDQYGNPKTAIQKFIVYKGTPTVDPLAECLRQHTDLVNACNTKDAQIKSLTDEANAYANTITEKNTEIDQLNQQIAALKAAQPAPAPVQTPSGNDAVTIQNLKAQLTAYQALVSKIKGIAYGPGYWWSRLAQIKAVLTQAGA